MPASFLVPLTSEFCVLTAGVVHAADYGSYNDSSRAGRRTVTTVCGARGKLYTARAGLGPDDTVGTVVLKWPPRVKTLRTDGLSRCPECHDMCTEKKPDGAWWPKP